MSFEYLDNESEQFLTELLAQTEFPCTWNNYTIKNLIDNNYLIGSSQIHGSGVTCFIKDIHQKGKSYFEMKEKHENNIERNRPVMNYIQTGDYSPVNSVIGNNNRTTQTVDYANNEQLKALEEFVVHLNTSTELSAEQKDEILEMIESIKETSKSGGKIKGFFIAVKTLLSGTATLAENWKSVKSRLGIGD